MEKDVYTRIASFHAHLKGFGSQGSIVSEFLTQSRDSDHDDYEKSGGKTL